MNDSVNSALYFNREISWLLFNKRVLMEAKNTANPLLERVRFLAISASNLDEFYSVRVAGFMGMVRADIQKRSDDGLTPARQLVQIQDSALELTTDQQKTWIDLQQQLKENGIHVVSSRTQLTRHEKLWLRKTFLEQIFPILTPIAIDPAHPFPFIPHQGMALIFKLQHTKKPAEEMKSLIPLSSNMPRFWRIPPQDLPEEEGTVLKFVTLETLIRSNLDLIFPDHSVADQGAFKILRDSDLEIEEDAEDLVREFESALKRRRRGKVIRLKIAAGISPELREFVISSLKAHPTDALDVAGLLSLSTLSQIITSDRPDLQFTPYTPHTIPQVEKHGDDIFAAMRESDFLVHHPYETFDVVAQFIRQAASDPDVVAIKQMLYRTSHNSPIVKALIDAAEAGKSVTAVVELKARFDEAANIRWAKDMERAGVHVVFGFMHWKTHAKVAMVVRKEGGLLRTYTHFGTGNYNPVTARIYTDLSLFTADPVLGRDATRLFNFTTGYIEPIGMEDVSVAPLALKDRLITEIEQETQNALNGKPAAIWAKMNALTHPEIIDALYKASQAGVKIELIIRGVCCLRPQVTGLSENIRVRSIVGRFLEHSRIICFGNGSLMSLDHAKIYISSADWMPRNLERRVETLVPVKNITVKAQILNQIMMANLYDNQKAWGLTSDGHYNRVNVGENDKSFNAHDYFMSFSKETFTESAV